MERVCRSDVSGRIADLAVVSIWRGSAVVLEGKAFPAEVRWNPTTDPTSKLGLIPGRSPVSEPDFSELCRLPRVDASVRYGLKPKYPSLGAAIRSLAVMNRQFFLCAY